VATEIIDCIVVKFIRLFVNFMCRYNAYIRNKIDATDKMSENVDNNGIKFCRGCGSIPVLFVKLLTAKLSALPRNGSVKIKSDLGKNSKKWADPPYIFAAMN